jgi:hypothetical protein
VRSCCACDRVIVHHRISRACKGRQTPVLSQSPGASVETQSERVFRIICRKPSELAHVGWILFQTHFVNVCDVTAVSGSAENRSNAYPQTFSSLTLVCHSERSLVNRWRLMKCSRGTTELMSHSMQG